MTPAGVPALKLKPAERDAEPPRPSGKASAKKAEADESEEAGSAQVVSLDSFRKKT